jgi:FtsP/CotA-like multicopper oxidase with cupredoxin domain
VTNRTVFAAALLAAPLLLAAGCLPAQSGAGPAPRAPGGPCAFQPIDVDRYGKQPFQNPPEVRAVNGRLQTTLAVQYTDPARTSIAGCPVRLRSYNGGLVGPTLRVSPGDVLAPFLDNRLPLESPAEVHGQFLQEDTAGFLEMRPYSFNTTNLHTHGLHVSPSGNSDNVLLAIAPQTSLQYDIRLPANHTRGSYWYHAHAHGSTAIQAGSGVAGALIVEDDPAAIPAALRAANEREKVFVIQAILYDTTGEINTLAAFFPDPPTDSLCRVGSPNCTWQNSRRHITVNGQIVPVITMRPGEVQRWRLIDATFRETLALRLEGHPLHEIATDGIYTGRIDTWSPQQELLLFPGYRSDVLVQASMTPGTYRLLDDSASTATALRGVAEDQNVIALLVVEGDPVDMRLPTAAEMAALDPFPGVDLAATADGVQEAVFKLGSGLQPTESRNYFQVNNYAFHDARVRYVELGRTEMWSLTTKGDPVGVPGGGIPPLPHVFHIHINPFQVSRTGPDGAPQTVWKDTQVVFGGQTVNVYTKYEDFTGKFVMHCHIRDHEDLGMMEAVEVVRELPTPHPPPDGTAGHGAHGSH